MTEKGYIIYSPNNDAKFVMDFNEGMKIVQSIIDVISPYNFGTARNALCFALVTVLRAIDSEDAVKSSIKQIIDMYIDMKNDNDVLIVKVPKNERKM